MPTNFIFKLSQDFTYKIFGFRENIENPAMLLKIKYNKLTKINKINIYDSFHNINC